MSIVADIRHSFGTFSLNAKLELSHGITCLFGHSGAGKSTLANIIAGLIKPDAATIKIGTHIVIDTANGLFVPAHKRRIGYVFQDNRLFTHMSVQKNLTYAARFTTNVQNPERFENVVKLLDIGPLLNRNTQSLSGGEVARVAIGRALLSNPALLIMDEPLANLDMRRRIEIMPYLERLRDVAGTPVLYISHAVGEVIRLADTVVLMEGGKTVKTGTAETVLQDYTLGRDEIGSLVAASVKAHDDTHAMTCLAANMGELYVSRLALGIGETVKLMIHSGDVLLASEKPAHLSAQNIFKGVVDNISSPHGNSVTVALDCNGQKLNATITTRAAEQLGLITGQTAYAIVKSIAVDRRYLAPDKAVV